MRPSPLNKSLYLSLSELALTEFERFMMPSESIASRSRRGWCTSRSTYTFCIELLSFHCRAAVKYPMTSSLALLGLQSTLSAADRGVLQRGCWLNISIGSMVASAPEFKRNLTVTLLMLTSACQ